MKKYRITNLVVGNTTLPSGQVLGCLGIVDVDMDTISEPLKRMMSKKLISVEILNTVVARKVKKEDKKKDEK